MTSAAALMGEFINDLLESEWNEVVAEHPALADRIQQLVVAGVTPKEISRQVILLLGGTRTGMARRLENAALYWHNQVTAKSGKGAPLAGGR